MDECAELLQPTGLKSEEGKAEDACKQEIVGLIKSITQLGRSSGMHIIVCPLRLSTVIPTAQGYTTMENIKPGDVVFTEGNQQTVVLSVSDVKMAERMYEMEICDDQGLHMVLGCDGEHHWPVRVRDEVKKESMDRIYALYRQAYNLKFVGGNGSEWSVLDMKQVDPEPVRCIEVSDSSHLFMVTDLMMDDWNGGERYEYPETTLFTYNTQRNDACLPSWLSLTVKRNGVDIDISWCDLRIGDVFPCGSECTAIGEWHLDQCWRVVDTQMNSIVATLDHMFKVDIYEPHGERMNGFGFEDSRKYRETLNEPDDSYILLSDIKKALEKGWYVQKGKGVYIEEVEQYQKNQLQKVRCIQTNSGYYAVSTYLSHNSIIPGV